MGGGGGEGKRKRAGGTRRVATGALCRPVKERVHKTRGRAVVAVAVYILRRDVGGASATGLPEYAGGRGARETGEMKGERERFLSPRERVCLAVQGEARARQRFSGQ